MFDDTFFGPEMQPTQQPAQKPTQQQRSQQGGDWPRWFYTSYHGKSRVDLGVTPSGAIHFKIYKAIGTTGDGKRSLFIGQDGKTDSVFVLLSNHELQFLILTFERYLQYGYNGTAEWFKYIALSIVNQEYVKATDSSVEVSFFRPTATLRYQISSQYGFSVSIHKTKNDKKQNYFASYSIRHMIEVLQPYKELYKKALQLQMKF